MAYEEALAERIRALLGEWVERGAAYAGSLLPE